MTLRKRPFDNIVGKGENAGHQHFLLYPQCFLPIAKHILIFRSHLFCRLQVLSIWIQTEKLSFGKELRVNSLITQFQVLLTLRRLKYCGKRMKYW